MASKLKFKDDWEDFYLRLTEIQKAHFIELLDKHACYQLNDVINELEDLKEVFK